MTRSRITDRTMATKSTWTGLLMVFVAGLTLAASSLIVSYYTQKGLREGASRRADSQLKATKEHIMDLIDQAELAVRNNIWITRWALDYRDSLRFISSRIVEENDVVVGSTIALVPGYARERPLFAPYFYKDGDSLRFRSLATPEYNYPEQEWFREPLKREAGYWSEPYVDEGGGEMLMTTYSYPIRDNKGKMAAILTADISLDWLSEVVGDAKAYPNAISFMLSRNGHFMVSPLEELIMQKSADEVISQMKDSVRFKEAYAEMIAGKSGNRPVWFRGNDCYLYYAPVERTGWSMGILIPHDDIFGATRRIGRVIRLLQLLGLLMLVVILHSFMRNQRKYNELNERKKSVEGELRVARGIQMSMVPKTFPPFPERQELDMAATIVPAKEVGGDLYDFFLRDDKLFFCIGDVSGKGIPASLVMAVTRTTFRNIAARVDSPGLIVTEMNDNLAAMNENSMFITFFCAALDLVSGKMLYCNAGHNPPMILSNAIRFLPVESNLALGIMEGMNYVEQEIVLHPDDAVFLYTDGLNEAENAAHEQFGEERMREALHERKSAIAHLENVKARVADFVGDAPQSDDLTMLFIHYLGPDGADSHKLTLHNDIRQVALLPSFIETIAEDRGFGPALTSSLNLAVEEAVTNVIQYAYPKGTEGTVDIEARIDGNGLTFIISDSGRPFDPTAREEVDINADLADRPIGGLGIHLIRRIMDSVNYERRDDKNILTITKRI